MNYHYGTKSNAKLDTCHPILANVMRRSLERSPYDITIIHGHRGDIIQNSLFDSGLSKLRYPDSKHNKENNEGEPCSEAIDFAPWVLNRIDWNDKLIFCVVAGIIMSSADELGVEIRWGGDWDGDGSSMDQSFMDIGHVEIIL